MSQWRSGNESGVAKFTPCPGASAPAGKISVADAKPGRDTSGCGCNCQRGESPRSAGATRKWLLWVIVSITASRGATCTVAMARMAPAHLWVPILRTPNGFGAMQLPRNCQNDHHGVSEPKQYRGSDAPMGGAQLTPDRYPPLRRMFGVSHR